MDFSREAMDITNKKWEQATKRIKPLYERKNEIRSVFNRDFTRILHCNGYRRLKHKTQVFFATNNDHICTRMEHVQHVSSVSYTLCKAFGLNTELAMAIAIGHDIGHAPFGHFGEKVIKEFSLKNLNTDFWHEKNSLRFVDKIETLKNEKGIDENLNLTYAVRDGILLHCGEVDETNLIPRNEIIDLNAVDRPGQHFPYTWEGCVVKVADKIAYLGRDIEDAITLKLLSVNDLKKLYKLFRGIDIKVRFSVAYTIIMYYLINDIASNSSLEEGISFSHNGFEFMKRLKSFNYETIYEHEKIKMYKKHAGNIIETIFAFLSGLYKGEETLIKMNDEILKTQYPTTISNFKSHLDQWGGTRNMQKRIYDLSSPKSYYEATIDFVSGMTDAFAIRCFNEITSFV